MLTINQQIQEITKVNEISINNNNVLCATNLQPYIIHYSSLHKKRFYCALKKASYCTPPDECTV